MFTRALLVSMTNPKTLLFYGAFFPQFVSSDHAFLPQVLLLSATFVLPAVLVDGSWALAAARAVIEREIIARLGDVHQRIAGDCVFEVENPRQLQRSIFLAGQDVAGVTVESVALDCRTAAPRVIFRQERLA